MIKAHRLLIIGNGFDLNIPLKSSFKDFFKSTYKSTLDLINDHADFLTNTIDNVDPLKFYKIPTDQHINPKYNNYYEDYIKIINELNSNNNFWLNYLLIRKIIFNDHIEEWNDIETSLYNFFKNENDSFLNIIIDIIETFYKRNNFIGAVNNVLPTAILDYYQINNIQDFHELSLIGDLLIRKIYASSNNDIVELLEDNKSDYPNTGFMLDDVIKVQNSLNFFEESQRKKLRELIIDFLRDELNLFEKDFNDYMYKQTYENDFYDDQSKKQIQKLSDGKLYSVLNFNYTTPNYHDDNNFIADINIHGKIKNPQKFNDSKPSLIIGVDGNNISMQNPEYIFTKTLRTISNNLGNIKSSILPETITEICFFGHSFSDSDYSYFKSIFDLYKIEDLKTNIILYYAEHDDIPETLLIRDQILSFSKLLDRYCKDKNMDTADTLLKQLQLNGKITVKQFTL